MSQLDLKSAKGGVLVHKPRSNVYTVMLVLALLAIIVGCVFLWLELQTYEGQIQPPPNVMGAVGVGGSHALAWREGGELLAFIC